MSFFTAFLLVLTYNLIMWDIKNTTKQAIKEEKE